MTLSVWSHGLGLPWNSSAAPWIGFVIGSLPGPRLWLQPGVWRRGRTTWGVKAQKHAWVCKTLDSCGQYSSVTGSSLCNWNKWGAWPQVFCEAKWSGPCGRSRMTGSVLVGHSTPCPHWRGWMWAALGCCCNALRLTLLVLYLPGLSYSHQSPAWGWETMWSRKQTPLFVAAGLSPVPVELQWMGRVTAWEFTPAPGWAPNCIQRGFSFISEHSHLWGTKFVFPNVCRGRLVAIRMGRGW